MKQAKRDIKSLAFEDALKELEDIVSSLERGEARLDEAIDLYTRGVDLRSHCMALLADAQAKVEKIKLSSDGMPEISDYEEQT